MKKFYEIQSPTKVLFNGKVELFQSVNELFEFNLAYFEYKALSKKDYLNRTAYAKSVNGESSNHFLAYSEIPDSVEENRSPITNFYFKSGQFSTGYATHSLFPYRGKFHPQLIKGLINILGIDKGDWILDPMAGSGTTNIEAALMGINSYAIDVSPFCQLMARTKYDALTIKEELLKEIEPKTDEFFAFFKKGKPIAKIQKADTEKRKVYNLALLAFLDALGYSKRVVRSNHEQLFAKVFSRYIGTVKNVLNNKYINLKSLGEFSFLNNSSALNVGLKEASVDAIITSPPYSFAIDYVENDKDQLEYLGYDTMKLKNSLIGLRGKTKNDKLETYFKDMDKFCFEAARVLKKGKYLVIIIGSNTNQTGGIRLEETVISSAKFYGMPLVHSILKPIKGMRNTMKDEYILIFEKT